MAEQENSSLSTLHSSLLKELTHKFDRLMKALYHQQGAQLDIHILEGEEAQSFIQTHTDILSSTFQKQEMTDKMRERLTRSNYIFSGMKTFHELNEAFPSLLDENGDRKPFERFLNDVRKIDETYNKNYLRAEYNFVQASATMAAKWERYSEDGDRYLLQYRTQHDDKVRPEHAALDRITLPMSDPFWESYYPPNGWNCFTAGTPVLTQHGWKSIESIQKGDLVIGGSGKLREVIGLHNKLVDDKLVCIITKGAKATCTPNHRFCTPHGWVSAESLEPGDIIIQAGEFSTLHLIVHAVANTRTLLRYALMAYKRKRKAVPTLAVNDKIEGWDEKIYNVSAKEFSLLEWQAHCRQVGAHDFFAFTQWVTKCAHALGMKTACGKRILQRLCLYIRAKKSGSDLELGSYATNELTVLLGLALANMKTLLGKAVVNLRKAITGPDSSAIIVQPLGTDCIAAMTDNYAKFFKEPVHDSSVDMPMDTKPSEAATLRDIPLFYGIEDIHAFDGFNSFFDFLRNTFFHNRYVLIEGKVTHKKAENMVYNLSIFKDESYIVPIGITHNCRCTVAQVLRTKYPETPHREAMDRGDEALNGERYSIFRFNSGKQQKAVPDYNPYTIRRCNDCNIANGKNVKLANNETDNQLCEACKLLRCMKEGSSKRIERNKSIYDYLSKNKEYREVSIDMSSGGVKAIHKEHNLDKTKGWYETSSQEAGAKNGHIVVLGAEPQNKYKVKCCEGTWDNLPFEVAGAESGTSNNIRNALKHCASKPDTKVAVLFFPNDNFTAENFYTGLAKYTGLKSTTQYRKFDRIYCIQGTEIVLSKKPD